MQILAAGRPLLRSLWWLVLGWATGAVAQPTILVSQIGPLQTCNAYFLDPGGQGPYEANESYVLTVCPDLEGAFMQVDFSSMDLGAGGELVIHAGPDITGTVIATSASEDLTTFVIQSTDPGGCLTFAFTAGTGNGHAGWAGYLQCYLPCDVPTGVSAPFGESPLKLCINEPFFFDGSGSTAAPNNTIATYTWQMGNGTEISGPTGQYAFSEPGEYTVSLRVTDSDGCTNTNYTGQQVRVATKPDLSSTTLTPSTICVGESISMSTQPEAVTWTNVPEPFVDGLVLLPDGSGVTYTANVTVGGFGQNAAITTPTDIVEVCFVMEHSYVGDLIVRMRCPDGQTVLLFDGNTQGAGNTYLGAPFDDPSTQPGTGWQYCFSNVGALGTLPAENAAGNHQIAGTPPSNSMVPGNYTSQSSFSNWIGCSLNGTWQIQVTDDQGADNGYIFSWWITINPSLYPNVIEFTPDLGLNCDSSGWTGPAVVQGPTCQQATAAPTTPGSYAYTYSVQDDFGCTYDTTFTVNVTPAADFEVFAEPIEPCADHVQLGTNMHPPAPIGPINYLWSPWNGLSSTTSPSPTADPAVPTWYKLWAQPFGHPLCGMADSILVYPLDFMEHDTTIVEALCHGMSTGTITVNTTGVGGPWDYTWFDATGSQVRQTLDVTSDTFTGLSGPYELHIATGTNGDGCVDTLHLELGQPDLLVMSWTTPDTTICLEGSAVLDATATGGTGALTVRWAPGLPSGTPQVVAPDTDQIYTVHATDAHGCHSDTTEIHVNVRQALSFTLPDTLIVCPRVDTPLQVAALAGGDSAYTLVWDPPTNSGPSIVNQFTTSQAICLTVTDGCETPAVTHCTWFEVLPLPVLVLSADTVEGCPGMVTTFAVRDTTSGAIVDWHFGDGISLLATTPTRTHTYNQPGDHDVSVRVLWPNGCYHDTVAVDMVHIEEQPGGDFTWTPFPPNVEWPYVDFHELSGPAGTDFRWVFHTGDTLTGPEVQYTYPGDVGGTYGVWHFASNYLGCTDSSYRVVEVEDAFHVFIPTAFSPDGDGFNEMLFVQGRDISSSGFHWTIHDRWGRTVYDSTDRSKGWDGRNNGDDPVIGVYPWTLRIRSLYTGMDHQFRGFVTILR